MDYNGDGFTGEQADGVFDCCCRVGCLQESIALIIRCNHSRRRSAAITKALGEWSEVWVKDPGLRYSRRAMNSCALGLALGTPDIVRLTVFAKKEGADQTRLSTNA